MISNPQAVKALLFDWGGVLINIDFERPFRHWEKLSSFSFDEIRRRFAFDDPYQLHERGEIDAREYFEHLRNTLALDGSDEKIAQGWNDIFDGEIAETINDIVLAKQKLPCFAFTNSNPTHQLAWTTIYPNLPALFEKVFVSSELGFRKPERAAFDAVSKAMKIPPSSILFFDDLEENVRGARQAGLQAVLVQSPLDVKLAFEKLNII